MLYLCFTYAVLMLYLCFTYAVLTRSVSLELLNNFPESALLMLYLCFTYAICVSLKLLNNFPEARPPDVIHVTRLRKRRVRGV